MNDHDEDYEEPSNNVNFDLTLLPLSTPIATPNATPIVISNIYSTPSSPVSSASVRSFTSFTSFALTPNTPNTTATTPTATTPITNIPTNTPTSNTPTTYLSRPGTPFSIPSIPSIPSFVRSRPRQRASSITDFPDALYHLAPTDEEQDELRRELYIALRDAGLITEPKKQKVFPNE